MPDGDEIVALEDSNENSDDDDWGFWTAPPSTTPGSANETIPYEDDTGSVLMQTGRQLAVALLAQSRHDLV